MAGQDDREGADPGRLEHVVTDTKPRHQITTTAAGAVSQMTAAMVTPTARISHRNQAARCRCTLVVSSGVVSDAGARSVGDGGEVCVEVVAVVRVVDGGDLDVGGPGSYRSWHQVQGGCHRRGMVAKCSSSSSKIGVAGRGGIASVMSAQFVSDWLVACRVLGVRCCAMRLSRLLRKNAAIPAENLASAGCGPVTGGVSCGALAVVPLWLLFDIGFPSVSCPRLVL